MPFHDQLPPTAWHGARVTTGTLAARPLPQVVGELYFVDSGASAGKLFIATGTTAQSDWKEIADFNNLPIALTVRDPSNNITLNPTTTLVFPSQWLTINTSTNTAIVTIPNAITVRDQSNNVSQNNVHTLIFPNSSITSPNPGEIQISFASSSNNLTVRNLSNTNSLSPTNIIIVPDYAVTFTPSTNTVEFSIPKNLTVRTVNSAVNQSSVDTIVFPDGAITSPSSGRVDVNWPSGTLTVEDQSQNVVESGVTKLVFPDGSLSILGTGEIGVDFSASGSVTVRDQSNNVSETVGTIIFPDGTITSNNPNEVEVQLSGNALTVRDTNSNNNVTVSNVSTIEIAPSSHTPVSEPFTGVARIDVAGFNIDGSPVDFVQTVVSQGLFAPTTTPYQYELNAVPLSDAVSVLWIADRVVTDAVSSPWYYPSLNAIGGSFNFGGAPYNRFINSSWNVFNTSSSYLRLNYPGMYFYEGWLKFRANNGLTHFVTPDLTVEIKIEDLTNGIGIFTNTHTYPTRAQLTFIDDASSASTTYTNGVFFNGYFDLRTNSVTLDFVNDTIALFYNLTLNGVLSTADVDIQFVHFKVIRTA